MSIRSTAKAIILDQDKILLNRCHDEKNGDYYTLPGGGQETYETLHEAIVRECREETGYEVAPLRFAALFEEICDDPAFRETHPQYCHKMLHIFVCSLASQTRLEPTEQDSSQIACEWIDIHSLNNVRLLPTAVGESIGQLIAGDTALFLGSVHIAHNHG